MAETASLETQSSSHGEGAIDMETHTFCIPKKEICSAADIQEKWEKSEAYNDLLGFIQAMSAAVEGKKLTDKCPESETIKGLLEILETMNTWIDEIPLQETPQRFGNKAFRDWFAKLKENKEALLRNALTERFHKAVPELSIYLQESVGNDTRIDYGTGHELAFAAFLCCLYKIGALNQEDSTATVFRVFDRYLHLARKLQLTYRMEPAGSQGVWNLDDYQFIWGSSQLIGHQRLSPKSFTNLEICEAFSKDYMFLSCIQFIHKVKTGPFAEHSNQLWNISGVPKWNKVNTGLIKMYKAEVLSKFPVIQHFLFGSLMRIDPVT